MNISFFNSLQFQKHCKREKRVYAVDQLIEETMKEYGVDTLEELGDMLTIESVMKS